jgi:hypothetical protein
MNKSKIRTVGTLVGIGGEERDEGSRTGGNEAPCRLRGRRSEGSGQVTLWIKWRVSKRNRATVEAEAAIKIR